MSLRAQRTLAALVATLVTASALATLFRGGGGWLLPVVAAVLLASGLGVLGRQPGVPTLLVPLLTPLGLVGLVTAVGSPANAVLGVVPSHATVTSLHDLVAAGVDDIHSYAAPVPATPGIILITVAGVYVAAALVDLLTVTAGRPVLAGAPLLALIAVPACLRSGGVGLVHFGLAAVAWVLVLALDGRERLTQWGRVLGRRPQQEDPPVLLGGAAGRVAGVSLAAALLLPTFLPAVSSGLFGGGGACCGGGSVSVVPPLVTVQSRLHDSVVTPLLSVSTSSPAGDYYRFTPLDDFDGSSFTLRQGEAEDKRVDGTLDRPTPGLAAGVVTRPVDATIQVGPVLSEVYLPLPYSPTSVTVPGRWQLAPDLRTVFSVHDDTRNLTFTVHSEVPEPTVAQLRAAGDGYDAGRADAATRRLLDRDLALPASVPSLLRSEAQRLTRRATTGFDRLTALQRWFTTEGGFVYDLNPGLPGGPRGIEAFLRSRRGYCEQFATAFTLMARSLGLPARVAVGFTQGRLIDKRNWSITNKDAHAWPEVWFDGIGWVRFEPTPAAADSVRSTPDYLAREAPQPVPQVTPSASAPASAAPTTSALPKGRGPKDDTPDKALPALAPRGGGGLGGGLLVTAGALLLLAALALTPGGARLLVRRHRTRVVLAATSGGGVDGQAGAAAHAAWAELLDTAADLRLPLRASESPRATGRRIAGFLTGAPAAATAPGIRGVGRAEVLGRGDTAPATGGAASAEVPGAAALSRLARAEERARYAPPRPGPPAGNAAAGGPHGRGTTAADTLAADTVAVRRALRAGLSRGARLRAALLPASVLGRARTRLAETLDSAAAAGGSVTGALAGKLRPHRSRRD